MREAAKAKSDAERQAFLAKKGLAKKDNPAGQRQAGQCQTGQDHRADSTHRARSSRPRQFPAEAMNVALTGNNGELRSEAARPEAARVGLFAGLFGGTSSSMSLLPETRALDAALAK